MRPSKFDTPLVQSPGRLGPSFAAARLADFFRRYDQTPAPCGAGVFRSVRVPDEGIAVLVILAGGAPEIGIDGTGAKLRGRHGDADIFPARDFAGTDPPAAQLAAAGKDAVIGLIADLAAIGDDFDLGADREGLEDALEALASALVV